MDGEGEEEREEREEREDGEGEEDEGDEVDEPGDGDHDPEAAEEKEGDDTSFSCCCPLMDNRVLFNASMFLCRT